MERFTFKKTHPYYKPGEEFPCIVAEDLTIVAESNSLDDVFYREFRPKEYAAGPAIDRLYDYEELGYTPDKLREILGKYKQLKRMASSPSGLTRTGDPNEWKEFVKHAMDRASKDKDVSVTVVLRENDVTVSVYPWPEEDESDDNG